MSRDQDQWQLFGGDDPSAPDPAEAAPPAPPEPETLTVSLFNERVAGYLRGLFPGRLRIRGYVSGFARSYARGSHVYFELVEKDPEDEGRDLSQISMIIWRGVRSRLRRELEALGGEHCELDDLEVVFEVSVNYYVPRARLSLVVEGIDVEASLGAQKLDRERILRRLAAEGLIEANRARPLPALPLRLALITSAESAAYHDFIKELGLSGLAFRLGCIDARVQGSEQEGDLRAAFATVARRAADFDAVVLIRGGGSRSDLAGFDAEVLARDIARCPLPVLTGIGHEIDRSIADEVAHRAFKTPTAVAQFLGRRVDAWLEALQELAARTGRAAEATLALEARRFEGAGHRLRAVVEQRLGRARLRLGGPAARLPGAARQLLRLRRLQLRHRAESIAPARLSAPARRARLRLDGLLQELRRRWDARSRHARQRLDHRAERLRLLDPQQVLARGFSLTRDARGRLLRDPSGLAPGERIHTRLAAGELESEIREIKGDGS